MTAPERLMAAIDPDMPHHERVAHAECVAQVIANALKAQARRHSPDRSKATGLNKEKE